MNLKHVFTPWKATAILVWGTLLSHAQEPVPTRLTWENFSAIESYVKLKLTDENYQKVTWHSTVIEGQRKAYEKDKPLLLWLYFGDPRGNC